MVAHDRSEIGRAQWQARLTATDKSSSETKSVIVTGGPVEGYQRIKMPGQQADDPGPYHGVVLAPMSTIASWGLSRS